MDETNIKIKYLNKFNGYQNFTDVTNMPSNVLAPGTLNTIINNFEKISPRAGTDYFGAVGTDGTQTNAYWTLAHRIHSKYDDFVNKQGVKMPFRISYAGTTAKGDVLETYLPVYVAGIPTATKKWYQVNAITPTLPILSTHRWYFAEWFDPAPTVLQSELVFTYGATNIGNYSGGFANITAVGAGTLKTDTVWEAKGFIWAPEGANVIVVNGVEHIVTGGFGTDTLTMASTAGISVDDIAFQAPYFNDTLSGKTIYDVCSSINNQVYYIDWKQRNVYISWDRNQVAHLNQSIYVGTSNLDDATFSGTFTGTTTDTYEVVIDTISPGIDNLVFNGYGSDVLISDTSGYTGGATQNKYQLFITEPGGFPNTFGYEMYKNGVLNSFGPLQNPGGVGGAFTLTLDGVTWNILAAHVGNLPPASVAYTGVLQNGMAWTLDIKGSTPDTFKWYLNGVLQASGITITGVAQLLSQGVSVTFINTIGHQIGDKWTMTALPTIIRGWSQYYYTVPARFPGEGFVITLDSNGWTMKPQEKYMLINAQAGHYYDVVITLSANLLSETIRIERLKSEPQNKVLFPYLLGYIKNQLAIISQEKTYDILGRQKFLELQQSKTLSDLVRIDFETSNWEDADILYYKRKIYFNLPKDNLIFIYDDFLKVWQPPQQFAKRISLLSIIDNTLVGHSYERNESYELFTGMSDFGLYGIKTRMVFPYESAGSRMIKKVMSAIGFEGYIDGNPVINWTANIEVGGCKGNKTGVIEPFLCIPSDTASLGKSGLGFHGLGNNPVSVIPHFFYIKTFDNIEFYQRNIELSCDSLDQNWSIIALGTDINKSRTNNSDITNPN